MPNNDKWVWDREQDKSDKIKQERRQLTLFQPTLKNSLKGGDYE